jgi:hypothetical protein
MRWCRYFPAGRQREHLNDLTRFVRQVRSMLDEVARKKGRARMLLGHRVPVTLDEGLNIGCDVEAWAKQRLADFLVPMDFLVNDLNLRTDEFIKAVNGTSCLVYSGFGSPQYSLGYLYSDRKGKRRLVVTSSFDQFRATAANWYAWGANGGSCFNMYLWPAKDQHFYAEAIAILSSPKQCFAGPRHYVYLPAWKDVTNFDPTGRHNALTLKFGADSVGKRQVFTFRMADGRNGEKLGGRLRFRIYDAVPGDKFGVDLNSRPVPAEKFTIEHQPQGEDMAEPDGPIGRLGATFTWPPGLRFDLSLADCPPLKGDNKLGITLLRRDPATKEAPVMEAMEVWVR